MTFLGTIEHLKLVLGVTLILVSIFIANAYGQTSTEFGHRLIPNKIVENTDAILEIYIKQDTIIPSQIKNLIVTSSDSSIIQILEIQENKNGFMTPIKIRAVGSGIVNIAIAAPGFLSKEIPITVYGNKNNPSQLLIKATPATFFINGPDKGYVSVELADEDGFPARAREDIAVTLTTSKSDVINLKNTELIIRKGEYYAVGEFVVDKPGDALIYVSSSSMQTANSKVSVTKVDEPLTIPLYVYPNKISSFSTNYAYAIVQLQDSAGNPIKAKNDIQVSLKISNADQEESVNTSTQFSGITSNENPVIKKGSYWGFAKVVTRGGLEGTYDISISAKDYAVSSSQQLEIINLELLDDESARLDLVPILATGQKELVGVMHLEDESGNPVASNKDLKIIVDSSDENSLSIDDVQIDEGFATALVFGTVGYTVPDTLSLNIATESDITITPEIIGPTKEALTLVAEPIIPKVLSNTNYPLALYMSEENGITYFPEDVSLSIPPNAFISVEPKAIKKGQSIALLDSTSLKEGSFTLEVEARDFSTSAFIDNLSSKPAVILLDYPETVLTNLMNTFSMQILDAAGNPVFADRDIEFKLVSNDQSIIAPPQSITIKQGDYYTLFDMKPERIGTTELAILSSDLPLTKFEISVTSITPQIIMSGPDYVNPNTNFDIAITVQHANSPLSGMNVEWNVQGATIKSADSVTKQNGMATISLLAQNPTAIGVQVTVSGGIFSSSTANKQIRVNVPLEGGSGTSSTPSFSILGINPLFIIIPAGAAAAGVLVLKKKNMLVGLTKKITIFEKINEVKEKLSHLREK